MPLGWALGTVPRMRTERSNGGDAVWEALQAEASRDAAREPVLASFLHAAILHHATLEDALSFHLGGKLATPALSEMLIREVIQEALRADPGIGAAVRADVLAVRDRDPAAGSLSAPFLYYKGFHALQSYRIAHWLWGRERRPLALYLQNRISERFAVDIHPAARIGSGIFVDHGTGLVIGETAVVGDDVSILQEVTLGGTGKERGDRHPKIRDGVLICAGAKVLGNIEIGARATIGAGSVVLDSVPAGCTAVGVPARLVGKCASQEPARDMESRFRPE